MDYFIGKFSGSQLFLVQIHFVYKMYTSPRRLAWRGHMDGFYRKIMENSRYIQSGKSVHRFFETQITMGRRAFGKSEKSV